MTADAECAGHYESFPICYFFDWADHSWLHNSAYAAPPFSDRAFVNLRQQGQTDIAATALTVLLLASGVRLQIIPLNHFYHLLYFPPLPCYCIDSFHIIMILFFIVSFLIICFCSSSSLQCYSSSCSCSSLSCSSLYRSS